MFKIIKNGSKVEDELAEAPALERVTKKRISSEGWHTWLERRPVQLTLLATVAILIGGIIQIVPTIMVKSNIPTIASVQPYTPLELEGRDIYIREGCVGCHSQMIRPFRSEVERYGPQAKAGEFVYDHPFLWGSKRTGPDLARVGGRYSDEWHRAHLYNPRDVVPESVMPSYPWLFEDKVDGRLTPKKMEALRMVGVPYEDADIEGAKEAVDGVTEIEALVAYLQHLGTVITKR